MTCSRTFPPTPAGVHSLKIAAIALIVQSLSLSVAEAGARLIEVSDGANSYQGHVLAMDSRMCCLVDRMGRMERLRVAELKSFRVISDQFRPGSVSEFRETLLREFGQSFELSTTSHYVVCAPRGRSSAYARIFEDVYRVVDQFFRVRGMPVHAPDAPLVAVVFGTQKEFEEYCLRDGVQWSADLLGYYSLRTNRVALFDDPELLAATTAPDDLSGPNNSSADKLASYAAVSGGTANTIIHETTHQVSYNIGIHSRAGGTPVWLVEGLATVMEAPGMRDRRSHGKTADRLNTERLDWFNTKYSERRQIGDLSRMIASDDMFRSQTLDAYSNAWAFTYFVSESPARSQQFSRYLQAIAGRNPMAEYTAEQRLEDFQDAFGDIARLEVEFQRSMDRLN